MKGICAATTLIDRRGIYGGLVIVVVFVGVFGSSSSSSFAVIGSMSACGGGVSAMESGASGGVGPSRRATGVSYRIGNDEESE